MTAEESRTDLAFLILFPNVNFDQCYYFLFNTPTPPTPSHSPKQLKLNRVVALLVFIYFVSRRKSNVSVLFFF